MSIYPETKAERIQNKYNELITPQEASIFLKCSRRTVTNLCNRGILKFEDIGTKSRRIPRFRRSDILAFLEKNMYFIERRNTGRKKAEML